MYGGWTWIYFGSTSLILSLWVSRNSLRVGSSDVLSIPSDLNSLKSVLRLFEWRTHHLLRVTSSVHPSTRILPEPSQSVRTHQGLPWLLRTRGSPPIFFHYSLGLLFSFKPHPKFSLGFWSRPLLVNMRVHLYPTVFLFSDDGVRSCRRDRGPIESSVCVCMDSSSTHKSLESHLVYKWMFLDVKFGLNDSILYSVLTHKRQ